MCTLLCGQVIGFSDKVEAHYTCVNICVRPGEPVWFIKITLVIDLVVENR